MNKHQKLNEEHQAQMAGLSNPDRYTFVDLGLPSGRLWATENAPGFYTFDEAVDTFGELLPKGSAMVELIEESTGHHRPQREHHLPPGGWVSLGEGSQRREAGG